MLRVAQYSRILSEEICAPGDFTELIFLASLLHDIGKLGIPDSILLKRGKLTCEERNIMQQHCTIGAKILSEPPDSRWWALVQQPKPTQLLQMLPPNNRFLELGASIAMYHHECWDGTGYPEGLSGEDIPIEARVVAVADVYDALGTARPYKLPFPEDVIIDIISSRSGSQFDPDLAIAFQNGLDRIRSVRDAFADDILPIASGM